MTFSIRKTAWSWLIGAMSVTAYATTPFVVSHPVPIAHWVIPSTQTNVYFVPRHAVPMVDVSVLFPAGSARDGRAWGLAHLTSAMLGTATRRYSEEAFASRVSETGAIIGTDVNRDMASVQMRTMTNRQYYRPAVALFHELLSHADFKPGIFRRIQHQTKTALLAQQDNPMAMAQLALFRELYGDHPYAHPIMGTRETALKISLPAVQAFFKRYYTASQATVVIVGDLTDAAAHRLAKRCVSGLPLGQPVPTLPRVTMTTSPRSIYHAMPKTQDTLLLGQLGVLPYDKNYYARLVGNYVLGGSGLTSVLYQEIREKRGLAYYAASQFPVLKAGSPFILLTQVRLPAAKQALHVMETTYGHFIQQGMSQPRLRQTKQSLSEGFPLKMVSNAQITSRLSAMVTYGFPLTFFADYPKEVKQVTLNQIKQAFQPFHPKHWVRVVAGGKDVFTDAKASTKKTA